MSKRTITVEIPLEIPLRLAYKIQENASMWNDDDSMAKPAEDAIVAAIVAEEGDDA